MNRIKNSRSPEIMKARIKYGMEAYGIYVALMDLLEESESHRMQKDYDSLAYEMRAEATVIQSIIEDYGLFELDGESFYSLELINRIEQIKRVSESRAKAGRAGGLAKASKGKETVANAKENLANAKQMPEETVANAKENLANAKQMPEETVANAKENLANAKQMPEGGIAKEKNKERPPHTPSKEIKKEISKKTEVEKDEFSSASTSISERKAFFLKTIQPYITKYGQKLIEDFVSYWTDMSIEDTRMRFEKETKFSIAGRLATWSKNELRYKGNSVMSIKQKETLYGIDWSKVMRWYNNLGLVEIKVLTDKRKQAYIAMYEAHGKEGIATFSENVKSSDYLLGINGKGSKKDYEYVFNETNYARILEGSFSNKKTNLNEDRKGWNAPQYTDTSKYRQGFGTPNRK